MPMPTEAYALCPRRPMPYEHLMLLRKAILAVFFSAMAASDNRLKSKLIPKFESLSQIGSSFSLMWQKIYLQQFLPSVRSN